MAEFSCILIANNLTSLHNFFSKASIFLSLCNSPCHTLIEGAAKSACLIKVSM